MEKTAKLPHQAIPRVVVACLAAMAVVLIAHYATQSTPDPIAFTVPILDMPVYWYGVVIMSAISLATWNVSKLLHTLAIGEFEAQVPVDVRSQPPPEGVDSAEFASYGDYLWDQALDSKRSDDDDSPVPKLHHSPDHAWNIVVYMLILGVVGARLYHVLTPQPSLGITPAYYFANPIEIFNLRNGGLGIFGAIAGAALGLLIYVARYRLPLLAWLDLGALAGAFAQFVGRWANYFNQELYGGPSSAPWAIWIDNPTGELAQFERFHPAFLYESIWSLLTFALLYRLWPYKHPGSLAAIYLICYGFGRILLETIRFDSNTTGGIATASLVSGGMIVFGAIALLVNRNTQLAP